MIKSAIIRLITIRREMVFGGLIMEENKVNELMLRYKSFVTSEQLANIRAALLKANDKAYGNVVMVSTKNSLVALCLGLAFGHLGVDRFYLGDVGLGIAKLLTFWGASFLSLGLLSPVVGIWIIVDFFLCYSKAKKINYKRIMKAIERF